MPVKPDLHIKEEPDGPVLKRCRTVSPSHMVLPNVMEMIAALGPASSPYQGVTAGGRNTPDYTRPGRVQTEQREAKTAGGVMYPLDFSIVTCCSKILGLVFLFSF